MELDGEEVVSFDNEWLMVWMRSLGDDDFMTDAWGWMLNIFYSDGSLWAARSELEWGEEDTDDYFYWVSVAVLGSFEDDDASSTAWSLYKMGTGDAVCEEDEIDESYFD